ncbi:hypothetical protein KTN05_08115 [Paracoccus sp. Z118]|uniref:hypothetical protein n=1 Tax=Paracoccus sp. Z118 TaxID=2851017 RepID=UPI001C2BBA62|nr:hypothetical protein [Paracoccus sp. Z118]MBV0891813.1 hypothetical protein [Paracoccus sp. Z118]
MIRKILPLLLTLLAFVAGAGAGDYLRGAGAQAAGSDVEAANASPTDIHAGKAAPANGHGKAAAPATGHGAAASATDSGETAWFRFPQQFFVPIMRNGRLGSTMVLSLSLELPAEATEAANAREIKLRDALLRQLLIHANTGGFDGNFTAEPALRVLRADLARTAQAVIPEVTAVLIGDIARQEAH